jgi:hypothetical protein
MNNICLISDNKVYKNSKNNDPTTLYIYLYDVIFYLTLIKELDDGEDYDDRLMIDDTLYKPTPATSNICNIILINAGKQVSFSIMKDKDNENIKKIINDTKCQKYPVSRNCVCGEFTLFPDNIDSLVHMKVIKCPTFRCEAYYVFDLEERIFKEFIEKQIPCIKSSNIIVNETNIVKKDNNYDNYNQTVEEYASENNNDIAIIHEKINEVIDNKIIRSEPLPIIQCSKPNSYCSAVKCKLSDVELNENDKIHPKKIKFENDDVVMKRKEMYSNVNTHLLRLGSKYDKYEKEISNLVENDEIMKIITLLYGIYNVIYKNKNCVIEHLNIDERWMSIQLFLVYDKTNLNIFYKMGKYDTKEKIEQAKAAIEKENAKIEKDNKLIKELEKKLENIEKLIENEKTLKDFIESTIIECNNILTEICQNPIGINEINETPRLIKGETLLSLQYDFSLANTIKFVNINQTSLNSYNYNNKRSDYYIKLISKFIKLTKSENFNKFIHLRYDEEQDTNIKNKLFNLIGKMIGPKELPIL